MEDINTGAKMAVTATILGSILIILLTIITISMRFSSGYIGEKTDAALPNYAYNIRALASLDEKVPVPSIYSALSAYGFENLAQFDIDVDGVANTDYSRLLNYFSRRLLIKVVETNSGIHVWVGD